jgi:hypothetical protein
VPSDQMFGHTNNALEAWDFSVVCSTKGNCSTFQLALVFPVPCMNLHFTSFYQNLPSRQEQGLQVDFLVSTVLYRFQRLPLDMGLRFTDEFVHLFLYSIILAVQIKNMMLLFENTK